MFCDLHCHSSGISTCCRIPYNVVVDTAKDVGFDAIVLTNHYCEDYTKDIGFDRREGGTDATIICKRYS